MNKPTRKQPHLHPYSFEPFRERRSIQNAHNKASPSCLCLLTVGIVQTYRNCNPSFRYLSSANPRRVITKPSQGVSNNNYDNINADLIFYVNDVLGLQQKNKYLVLDLLGQGTFGQVVKCKRLDTGELVAVKAVKNRPAYFNQGTFEVHVLEQLNSQYDPDLYNIVQLKDYFIDRQHLCLVFELLSVNMFDLIKQNRYRGLSTNLIRVFLRQILKTLRALQECGIIHCDLKPENILLRNQTSPQIKLIDFGSACYENQTVYTYIQSRFYRSPEVIIGYPYNSAIDMWSLGCIAAELFLGLPLFPGHNEYNQLIRIMETQGDLPETLLNQGKFTSKFYAKIPTENGGFALHLKSEEHYCHEQNVEPKPFKRYFQSTKLADIIQNYRHKKNLTEEQLQKEQRTRVAFTDFLMGLLKLDPAERWTAEQASCHPFITGEPFSGAFVPPPKKLRDQMPSLTAGSPTSSRAWGSTPTFSSSFSSAQIPIHPEQTPYIPLTPGLPDIGYPSIDATGLQTTYSEQAMQHKSRRSRSISVDTKRNKQAPTEPRHVSDNRLGRGQGHKVNQRGSHATINSHHSGTPSAKHPTSDKRGRAGQVKQPPPVLASSSSSRGHRRSLSNENSDLPIPNPTTSGDIKPHVAESKTVPSTFSHPAHLNPSQAYPSRYSVSSHQHPPRSPRSNSGAPSASQDKQPATEKYSPRQGHRGKEQFSPRKSPRRSKASHKSSPPDIALNYTTTQQHHQMQSDGNTDQAPSPKGKQAYNSNTTTNHSHNNKPHSTKPTPRTATTKAPKTNAPVLARGRQALSQRKPPDKSSTWPGPAPPIHALSPPTASVNESHTQTKQNEISSFNSQYPHGSSGSEPWDPSCTDDTLLFSYDEGPSFPSSFHMPTSAVSVPPSSRVSPTQNKTSPRGQGRGRGHVGASQPISIKQGNQRRTEPLSSHNTPTRRNSIPSSAASFSEWSDPPMPGMDSSPSSYGMRWQEDEGRTSDLVFGVSPTDMGSGFYGRNAHIGSSPHGGVGEFYTPPRFHYIQPGTAQQQRHPTSYNPYPPSHSYHNYRRERQGEGDMSSLAQRFASSSIDDTNESIEADSSTDDGPAVND